jgi:hypothetical protein
LPADGMQAMEVRPKILMAMKRMGMMKSSTLSISDKSVTLSTTRCTGSWSNHYNLV